MEPQWNPTVEEQALARVHRMGQTKPVTTIRFMMENTFEEVGVPTATLIYGSWLTCDSVLWRPRSESED